MHLKLEWLLIIFTYLLLIPQSQYSSQNSEYPEVLKELYERSQKFLLQTEPQFLQENPLQQLRKQCLELFQKVPNNDHNKQYSKIFMNILMKLVEVCYLLPLAIVNDIDISMKMRRIR